MYAKILLFSLSGWLISTILVDFVVVPTLFSQIDDIMHAGTIGVILFTKMNVLEMVFSALILFSTIQMRREKQAKILLFGASCLAFIALLYYFHLTPRITGLTNLLLVSPSEEVAREHQFYHDLYVKLDSLKLIILGILGTMFFIKKEKI